MSNFTSRTDAKLRYARVHLNELSARQEPWNGDDWERAHYEAFWFHLLGAVDSYLREANDHYAAGLAEEQVRLRDLMAVLQKRRIAAPDLAELDALKRDDQSFLRLAEILRHRATHQAGNALIFSVGAGTDAVRYKDPRVTQDPQNPTALPDTVSQTSESLLKQFEALIIRLRAMRP